MSEALAKPVRYLWAVPKKNGDILEYRSLPTEWVQPCCDENKLCYYEILRPGDSSSVRIPWDEVIDLDTRAARESLPKSNDQRPLVLPPYSHVERLDDFERIVTFATHAELMAYINFFRVKKGEPPITEPQKVPFYPQKTWTAHTDDIGKEKSITEHVTDMKRAEMENLSDAMAKLYPDLYVNIVTERNDKGEALGGYHIPEEYVAELLKGETIQPNFAAEFRKAAADMKKIPPVKEMVWVSQSSVGQFKIYKADDGTFQLFRDMTLLADGIKEFEVAQVRMAEILTVNAQATWAEVDKAVKEYCEPKPPIADRPGFREFF